MMMGYSFSFSTIWSEENIFFILIQGVSAAYYWSILVSIFINPFPYMITSTYLPPFL